MIKWPLLNYNTVGSTAGGLLIGREKEIDELFDDLKENGSIRLITGESGVGKSALLDEVYRRLNEVENQKNQFFVGYYSRKESLIAESESLIYPFRIILESLIKTAKESQQLNERIDNTLARVKRGLVKFAKDQGIKMGIAIIEDLAKKVGLEQTLEIGKDVLKTIGSEKTSMMLAQGYVTDHRDEARESYLNIFRSLADEFKDRRFVLIFDQFEYVGKASIDFFLNFAKFIMLQERFHVIVSFRTDDTTLNDPSIRPSFEDLRRKIKNELGGKEMQVEGLSAEDIGKWIKIVRGISLPTVPDLQRIRENSAGLPILLEEWINSSKDLNYQEIKRGQRCSEIIKLKKGLNDEEKIKLYRLSILLQPLDEERLAKYFEMEDIDYILPFIERLIENRIFYELKNSSSFDEQNKNSWFRHELIQKCFEDQLNNERRKRYHDKAAAFFLDLEREKKEATDGQHNNDDSISMRMQNEYRISISCAYHIHMAERYPDESYKRNKELAEYASSIGDLDLAERCYKRAIIDAAERLGRTDYKMDCLYGMTAKVYFIWGRHKEALENYHTLLKYYGEVNDRRRQGYVLNHLAAIHHNKGEYEQAIELYKQSLDIQKQFGDQKGIARTLNNIGMFVSSKKGKREQAIELFKGSLEIFRQLGDQEGIARTLSNLGTASSEKGEYEQAIELYIQSLEIFRRLGDQKGIAHTLTNLGYILIVYGEYNHAIELYKQSLEISRRLGDQLLSSRAFSGIALIHINKGEYEQAIERYKQSLEIFRQLGAQEETAIILKNIADVFLQKRDYQKAVDYAKQARIILEGLHSPSSITLKEKIERQFK